MHRFRRLVWVNLAVWIVSLTWGPTAGAEPQMRVFPETGFAVSNMAEARFLSEFGRLGGVEVLGYPISQPFDLDGFTYQAFQRAVLQWRPDQSLAVLANVMEWPSGTADSFLLTLPGIPPAQTGTVGLRGRDAQEERESWLTDEAIAAAYRRGGGAERYGLPTSRPTLAGPFVAQRFQRYVFQRWIDDVPGMPERGSVVGVLVGELLVRAGVVPAAAVQRPPEIAALSMSGSGAGSGEHVTAVGDSVMLGAARELERVIGDVDVDATVSRQVSSATETLRAAKAAGRLGPVVLLHIGNNGTFTAGQFDEIMQILSDARLVVFVNVKVARAWETPNNAVIAEGVKRHRNALLVDWYGASIGHPDYFWDDGIHLRPEGARAYAELANQAVRDP